MSEIWGTYFREGLYFGGGGGGGGGGADYRNFTVYPSNVASGEPKDRFGGISN